MEKEYYVVLRTYRSQGNNYYVFGNHYGSPIKEKDHIYLIDKDGEINKGLILAVLMKEQKARLLISTEKPLNGASGLVLTLASTKPEVYDKPQVNQRLKGLIYEVNSKKPLSTILSLLFEELNKAYLGTMLKVDEQGNKQTIVLTTKTKESFYALFTDKQALEKYPGNDMGDHLISIRLCDFWLPESEEDEKIGVVINPFNDGCLLNLSPMMLKTILRRS